MRDTNILKPKLWIIIPPVGIGCFIFVLDSFPASAFALKGMEAALVYDGKNFSFCV